MLRIGDVLEAKQDYVTEDGVRLFSTGEEYIVCEIIDLGDGLGAGSVMSDAGWEISVAFDADGLVCAPFGDADVYFDRIDGSTSAYDYAMEVL